MKLFAKYIELIAKQGITPEIIRGIIADHAYMRARMLANYERYKAEKDGTGVPIYLREFDNEEANKINNKLANDFFSEIIDTKIGYMFGQPVTVMLDKSAQQHEELTKQIERFRKVNNLDDLNSEAGKFAAMCGYDGLLLYIDREGQERLMRVNPWETVIISETEITEPTYGLIYYKTHDDKARVEFYDQTNVHIYQGDDFAQLELVETKAHLFDYCPLFGLPNNAELQGDADKVLSLIDAYDRAISDMNSEIEQFRLAYMMFIGYAPDEGVLNQMRRTGALFIPDCENGEDIKFLTKQIDHEAIDSHLNRLEANITRFAKHVNFTDEQFAGNLSGVAMRFKLFALETKAKTMERKHEAAMLYMFKVLASAWRKRSLLLDYTQLDIKYTRNIPVNIKDEADAAKALLGVTSHQTALSQLSFVEDVEEEMRRIEEERDAMMVDLDAVQQDEGDERTVPEDTG